MTQFRHFIYIISIFSLLALVACGGGGGSTTNTTDQTTTNTTQNNNSPATITLSSVMGKLQSWLPSMVTSLAVNPGIPKISGTASGIDYTADILGYAYCTPTDLYAAPDVSLISGITSVYGCDNSLTLEYVVPDPSTLIVTIAIPAFYIDFNGSYKFITDINFDGYAMATNVSILATLNIIDNGDGTYKIDTSSLPDILITTGTLDIVSDDDYFNIVIAAIELGTFGSIDTLFIDEIESSFATELQIMLSSLGNFVF